MNTIQTLGVIGTVYFAGAFFVSTVFNKVAKDTNVRYRNEAVMFLTLLWPVFLALTPILIWMYVLERRNYRAN